MHVVTMEGEDSKRHKIAVIGLFSGFGRFAHSDYLHVLVCILS